MILKASSQIISFFLLVCLSHKDLKLRFDLMKEENEEYLDAAKKGDLIEIKTPSGAKNFEIIDVKYI